LTYYLLLLFLLILKFQASLCGPENLKIFPISFLQNNFANL
jgi:hypothetical protein